MIKRQCILTGAIGLLVLASACTGSGATSTSSSITRQQVPDSVFKPKDLEATIDNLVAGINKAPSKTLQIGVALKAMTGYFQPVVVGANRAMGELKAVGGVSAPGNTPDFDAAEIAEIDIINNYIGQNYDGFGVAPFEEVIAPAMNEASDKGIPVVTIDSDLPDSKRQVYVGTINAAAGTTAGQTLINLLAPSVVGTVIILGHDDPGWLDGYNRTMAAKQALEATGFTVEVHKTEWASEATEVPTLTGLIQAANPPVVGMLGMFSDAYRCAMAAEAAGMAAGDIKIAAFDFDPNTINYMRSGYIQATHAQRQYYMGYVVPYILTGISTLGLEQTKAILEPEMIDTTSFNTGLDVIPTNDLDGYYSFLDSLGVGSQ